MSPIETWIECDWVGNIKAYEEEPKKPNEVVENLDDYDVRHEFGSKVHFVRSRFSVEEF